VNDAQKHHPENAVWVSRLVGFSDEMLDLGFEIPISEFVVLDRESILSVPNSYLLSDEAGQFVKKKVSFDSIQTVRIKTGVTDYRFTEILSGIGEGDTIYATTAR